MRRSAHREARSHWRLHLLGRLPRGLVGCGQSDVALSVPTQLHRGETGIDTGGSPSRQKIGYVSSPHEQPLSDPQKGSNEEAEPQLAPCSPIDRRWRRSRRSSVIPCRRIGGWSNSTRCLMSCGRAAIPARAMISKRAAEDWKAGLALGKWRALPRSSRSILSGKACTRRFGKELEAEAVRLAGGVVGRSRLADGLGVGRSTLRRWSMPPQHEIEQGRRPNGRRTGMS